MYPAEMGITLLSDIDRYTLEDALVTLVFHLVLADGSVEDVPMGVFEFSSSFSDFITRYTAVSSTNKQTQIAEYYALDPDNGLTMDLGVNPLLQFGLEETREMLCRNILADLSVIRYVPFDSDTIGNPALDPGDVLTFAGGQADEGQITCITSIRQKIGIHTFTNASAHEIGQTRVKLISIQFASSEENHMQFFAQVVVDVAADPVERSAEASGTVVIPFTGGSGSGTFVAVLSH